MIGQGFHNWDIFAVVIFTWSVSESITKKKQRLHVYGFTVHPVGILYLGHHLSLKKSNQPLPDKACRHVFNEHLMFFI